MTVYFYSGPSLGPAEVEARAGRSVDWRPPVRHGDLLALDARPGDQVVIVDGVFHQSAPVRHKEILDLLDRGVTVVGASSMGALRAAELHRYGMVGVGTVYDWYRRGVVEADDEVVVAHLEDGDYRAISEPLVNVRFVLAEARRQGWLDADDEARTLEIAASTPFEARSWGVVRARARAVSDALSDRLARVVETVGSDPQRWNVKRHDALAALERVVERSEPLDGPRPVSEDPRWRTMYLNGWRNSHRLLPAGGAQVPLLAVLQWTQLFDPTFPDRLRALRLRWVAGDVSAGSGSLEQRASAAVEGAGLRWSDVEGRAAAYWLTDEERVTLPPAERLLRAVLRSGLDVAGLPPDELRELVDERGEPLRRAAEALEINRLAAAAQPSRSTRSLRLDRLVESLRQEWRLADDEASGVLDACARDRGFAGWVQAVEVYRQFHLATVRRRRERS